MKVAINDAAFTFDRAQQVSPGPRRCLLWQ